MKGYWLRCEDCGEKLIAKSKADGRVETWHRDRPCRKPAVADYWADCQCPFHTLKRAGKLWSIS